MSSPFPGMDPWLESPAVWPGFHHKLINEAVAVLQPQLRGRGYYIDSGERVYLAEPGRGVYPDNVLYKTRPPRGDAPAASLAVLEPDEPILVARTESEVREPFLEVYDAAGHRLVTSIEYVSPANKTDARGRAQYRQKQEELREAGVNLVEVDLLRAGPHVLDIPLLVVDALRPWSFLVNLARVGAETYEFYLIGFRQRLPRIRLPLKNEEEDAVFDLQEVFDRAYEIGPYPERLNYNDPPTPPLSPDDDEWAQELLREKGFFK